MLSLVFLTALLLIRSSLANDPRLHADNGISIVWTSMRWCSTSPSNNCHYPEHAWQYMKGTDDTAVLQWGQRYELTWQNWNSSHPVRLRWFFDCRNLWNKTLVEDPTTEPCVRWEYNTTAPSPFYYIWTPSPSDFPNSVSNISGSDAIAYAALDGRPGHGCMVLDQPDISADSHQSAGFVVLDAAAVTWHEYTVQLMKDKVAKGLGLGLGIGLPVLMLLTVGLTLLAVRMQRKREGQIRLEDNQAEMTLE